MKFELIIFGLQLDGGGLSQRLTRMEAEVGSVWHSPQAFVFDM